MKEAIRYRLIEQCSDLGQVIFHPKTVDLPITKPYAVLVPTEDTSDANWTGYRSFVEIMLYFPSTSSNLLEVLSAQVIAALDKQIIRDPPAGGQVYTCFYMEAVGLDIVNEVTGTISRCMRFMVNALQPIHVVNSSSTDDVWLEALSAETETLLGPHWTCYRGVWPMEYQLPAVMWRMTELETRPINAAMFEVRKKMVGHVLGATSNQQADGIMQIVQALGNASKLPLDRASKQYVTLIEPRSNMLANAVTEGQITATLSKKIARLREEVTLIQEVQFHPIIQ